MQCIQILFLRIQNGRRYFSTDFGLCYIIMHLNVDLEQKELYRSVRL